MVNIYFLTYLTYFLMSITILFVLVVPVLSDTFLPRHVRVYNDIGCGLRLASNE